MGGFFPHRAQSTSPITRRAFARAFGRGVGGGLAGALAGAAGLAPPSSATESAQEPVIAPGLIASTLDTRNDLEGRVVAPAYVNEQGPFRFIVDTGANRSVISTALAKRLGLEVAGMAEVHGVAGVQLSPFCRMRSLRSGAFSVFDGMIPILGEDMLGGADGMLGVDGMAGRRLQIDNRHHTLTIENSGEHRPSRDGYTVPVQFRFGQLTSARASIGDIEILVLFDTGADVALATPKLRDVIGVTHARDAVLTGSRLLSASRPIIVEDGVFVPLVKLRGVDLNNIPAAVSDFHVFHLWGIADRPALVLGMHVLSVLRSFAIDYGRKEVQMRP